MSEEAFFPPRLVSALGNYESSDMEIGYTVCSDVMVRLAVAGLEI